MNKMFPGVLLVGWPVVLGLAAQCAVSCSTWTTTGSLYRGRCTHVGVRPASDAVGNAAVTVQISTDAPRCPP